MTEPTYDVIVVGAGPAGSAAAFHIARRGWRVALFEKSRMPRSKACGDGLGPGAVAQLHNMNLDLEGAAVISGVDVRTNGKPAYTSAFRVPKYGLMLPRSDLDDRLARQARAAGSAWHEACRVTGFEVERGRITGVRSADAATPSARTRFVVLADGGNSVLAKLAGLGPRLVEVTGYAVRGYFSNVPAAPHLFRIHLPLTDPQSGRALPGYGWVFPMDGHRANIGVGFFPGQSKDRELNLRELFTTFLNQLRAQEPAMADIRLEGRWIGGLLRSGMDPSRCVANGAVAVGDAAGLVDPFTGEGVDTALVSGRLAAEVLDVALARDDPRQLAGYPDLLEEHYRDRFQLGRRFVRTYSFIWKLLQSTVDQDTALLHGLRQALFGYDGSDAEQKTVMGASTSTADAFGAQVQARVRAVASDDLPVFARICLPMQHPGLASLRQRIAYWSHWCGGRQPGSDAVAVASSVELVRLAHGLLAEVALSSSNNPAWLGQTNRWANSFAIMSGNYLLVRAFSVIHLLQPNIIGLIARGAAVPCQMEIEAALPAIDAAVLDISPGRAADAAMIEGQFCALACRAAAQIGGCSAELQEALGLFGSRLGTAVLLARATTNRPTAATMAGYAANALELVPDGAPKFQLREIASGVAAGTANWIPGTNRNGIDNGT